MATRECNECGIIIGGKSEIQLERVFLSHEGSVKCKDQANARKNYLQQNKKQEEKKEREWK